MKKISQSVNNLTYLGGGIVQTTHFLLPLRMWQGGAKGNKKVSYKWNCAYQQTLHHKDV